MLREPRSALKRADLALFTRCQPGQVVPDLGLPSCSSEHRLTGFTHLGTGEELPLEKLQQGRVAAFAGIADPSAFFDGLQDMGIQLVATLPLSDHASYGVEQVAQLKGLIVESSPVWLLTTEKDGVKLLSIDSPWIKLVVTVKLTLCLKGECKLFKLLNSIGV
jgi:tetraacyldisaccharide 4'-kinase